MRYNSNYFNKFQTIQYPRFNSSMITKIKNIKSNEYQYKIAQNAKIGYVKDRGLNIEALR